jgi:hypothetical protein
MNKKLFTNALPYVVALVIFLLVTFIYFNPVFQGSSLRQGDIMHFQGMAKEIVDYREKTGEEALWTNSMFGGMPAYQISVKYNANLVKYVDQALGFGFPRPVNIVFLYFLGFFILLITLRVNPWLAIVGALAYGFSSYFFIIIEAGHNSKAHAIAYMAPMLAGIILTFRGKYLLGGVLTALFAALELSTNHLQITYYLIIALVIITISQLVDDIKAKALPGFLKAVGVLLLAGIIAVLPNITNILTTLEYSGETTRGKTELTNDQHIETSGLDKDYATQWSYGVGETWTLLIPNAKGGASDRLGNSPEALEKVDSQMREMIANQNHYWGEQPFTSGPVYAGAIIMFLFVLGLFIVRSNLKWALLAVTILSIMLAWGKNFAPLTWFFMDYFPGYNKFRTVSMILVLAELCIPLLGLLALNELITKPSLLKEKKWYFFAAFGATAGISLLFWLIPSTFFSFITSSEQSQLSELVAKGSADQSQVDAFLGALETARISLFKADAIRSFLFIALAFAAIYAYAYKKINTLALSAIMLVLVIGDMYTINRRYLNEKSFERTSVVRNPFTATEADKLIMKDVDPNYRVLNTMVNTFNDASTSYFHKSIGGYHGAKLERYQELIENQISKNNMQVYNMLNTKYFIVPGEDKRASVQVNMEALGNAWFVDTYKIVDNADQEMKALDDFDAAKVAIVDKRFEDKLKGFEPSIDSTASIKLTNYKPNYLAYESKSLKDRLTVFSEIYYPKGWNAFIDGKTADHFRVNYVLRALVIPAGEHKIEFKFEPKSYFTGEKIAFAGSLLLLFLLIGVFGLEIKKMLKPTKTA